jgi:hypothetical protein
MLSQKLLGANGTAPSLQFVGGVGLSLGATQTPSYSLTGLSGGLASAPAIGDIVIACVAIKNSTDRNIQCTTSGYTELADLFSEAAQAPQLGVYKKTLTAADTSIAFDIGVSTQSRFVCHVWRNINSTALDATTTTNEDDGGIPNPPSITTVTDNAVVIAVGVGGASSINPIFTPTAPSGMENLFLNFSSTTFGIAIASILRTTAGAYDPGPFGGFNSSSSNGSCAATLALRPV